MAGASRGFACSIRARVRAMPLMGPVIARVAAGSDAPEAHLTAATSSIRLFTPRADYLCAYAHVDAGRRDSQGDLLAVHRTHEARSGQIVVARLADEVTVKRYRRRGNTVQLLPENPDFEPIEVDLRRDALAIEGIGVGVIRSPKSL